MKHLSQVLSRITFVVAISTLAVAQNLPGDQITQLIAEAQAGNTKAEYELAHRYEVGDRVPKDKAKAIELYKKAAEQGYAPAQERYADFAATAEERLLWLRKAASSGSFPAARVLANSLSVNGDVLDNYSEAAKWWAIVDGRQAERIKKVLAQIQGAGLVPGLKEGDASAQCETAMILLSAEGLPGGTESATKLMSKAANQGNPDAQYLLGELISSGKDGNSKIAQQEALKRYSDAASKGNVEAEVRLGEAALRRGDFNVACRCYDKADYAEAMQHFQRAAVNNSASAFYRIAQLYESGIPTLSTSAKSKSPAVRQPRIHDAFLNYSKAADLGSPAAQLVLVAWYSGRKPEAQEAGVPVDSVRAAMWAWVLKSSDDKEARFQGTGALNRLIEPSNRQQSGLTTPELQEAQQMAKAWLTNFNSRPHGEQKGHCRLN